MQHLDAAAVAQRLPFDRLVAALRAAFAAGVEVPARHVHRVVLDGAAAAEPPDPGGTVLLMPAWRRDDRGPLGATFGVKTVGVFPGNAALGLPAVHAAYTLFSARTGQPLATLDGSELTARRTAAASALAASFLAAPEARTLLVVGAGRVGHLMPEAMRSVRPSLARVRVWNRSPGPAEGLVQALRAQGWEAEVAPELPAAVAEAEIVSCATLADAPLVQGAWLARGAHLDLIGSFTPQMREADAECFARSRVFVDTEEALAKAGDVLQAVSEGAWQPSALQGTLSQLCRGERPGRQQAGEITLFKSVGTALEDLAAAETALLAAE